MEKWRPYNIKARHVRGETNFLPDRLSRYPKQQADCPEFEGVTPTISNKSLRLSESGLNIEDPQVLAMAE